MERHDEDDTEDEAERVQGRKKNISVTHCVIGNL